MADIYDVKRFRQNYLEEQNSAALYLALAEYEKNAQLADVYRRLSQTEEKHAGVWAERLRNAGADVPEFRLSLRTRILIRLARHFGVDTVLPAMSSMEQKNSHAYDGQAEAAGMIPDERSHARLLRQLEQGPFGMAGSLLARIEGRHRAGGGNALRAAVLGASDGLLSNFNLVMGVVGAKLSGAGILLTGFAGLLAGAISMGLGEWISVQSSRELYEKQISVEAEEIKMVPEEETEELVLIYQARGMDEETARHARHAAHEQSRQRTRYACPGRTRRESRRPGRFGLASGHHLVPSFCRRRYRAGRAISFFERHCSCCCERRGERRGTLCRRLRNYTLYREIGALLRHTTGALWSGRGCGGFFDRTAGRGGSRGLSRTFRNKKPGKQ